MRNNNAAPQQLDRATILHIAAIAGVDPRTAARHAANPSAPVSPKGGGMIARAAVRRAAEQLGVRLP